MSILNIYAARVVVRVGVHNPNLWENPEVQFLTGLAKINYGQN